MAIRPGDINLFDNHVTNIEHVIFIIIFIIIAAIVYGLAELFRRRIYIAFYFVSSLFIIQIPLMLFKKEEHIGWFSRAKYFIVNIPYLVIVLSLISIVSEQYYNNKWDRALSKLLNKFLVIHTVSNEEQKREFHKISTDENNDIYGSASWVSWFFYLTILINIIVAGLHDRNLPNAICAILLCLPCNVPLPVLSWNYSKKHEYYLYINEIN